MLKNISNKRVRKPRHARVLGARAALVHVAIRLPANERQECEHNL